MRRLMLAAVLAATPPVLARADALDLGAPVVERAGEKRVALTIDPPRPGIVDWLWTDPLGRVVMRRQTSVDGSQDQSVAWLDLARAGVGENAVRATFDGATLGGTFTAQAAPGWPAYPVILWHTPPPGPALARLPSLGVTAVRRFPVETTAPDPHVRLYYENITTDFYAAYHRYLPGRPVTALFDEAKARHRADPADPSVFVRTPSLSDPAALLRTEDRLREVVRRPGRALFYNLGDETGIGDLAAAWDFDLAPDSLAGFRAWLRGQYGTLAALNAEWGAHYAEWDAVAPELTTAAMRRTNGNYSAWADFKAWMDESFARALRAGARAVHEADPAALAGLEGAQVPGWGGYDYGRIAGAVDVMEVYDSAANLDIAQSLAPGLITLETSFESGPVEVRRLWRDRLRGVRGLILWDENEGVIRAEGTPGPRGAAMAPAWRDLAGPAAEQFAAAEVRPDPVAVLYSQASFRTEWMLAHAEAGDAWTARDAEREGEDTFWRSSLRRVQSALAHLALTPRWIDDDRLAAGALRDPALRALLLPRAIALSDAELAEIASFQARGGLVLAEGPAGAYDGHSRRRADPPVVGEPAAWPGDEAGYAALAAKLPFAPIHWWPGVEAYVRWTGDTRLVALLPDSGLDVQPKLTDLNSRVKDDAQPAARVLRTAPVIVALGPRDGMAVQGPDRIRRVQDAKFTITIDGAAKHVVAVTLRDPAGATTTQTIQVAGHAVWAWRPIEADPAGNWTIEFADALSGIAVQRDVALE